LQFSQSLTTQGASPLVSLVHSAFGAIFAGCAGANLSLRSITTYRHYQRLRHPVMTYQLLGMLLLVPLCSFLLPMVMLLLALLR
jgi:hypothetical protein